MGLTECGVDRLLQPAAIRASASTARRDGRWAVEARVVAPDGAVLADGVAGEIELRGESVMQGYYKDPETTARTLRRGRLARDGRPRATATPTASISSPGA